MPSIRRWSVVVGAVLVGLIVGWTSASLRADADKPAALVYELRTYTTEEGRLPALHARTACPLQGLHDQAVREAWHEEHPLLHSG